MENPQQPPHPGFQPYVAQSAYAPQPPSGPQYGPPNATPYPQQAPPAYPQQVPPGYPQQVPPAYPQQAPPGYPQVPPGYPQQVPPGYPQQVPPGYPNPKGYNNFAYPGPQAVPMQTSPQGNLDVEVGKDLTATWAGFTDRAIRAVFVRKVYAILMLQLLFSLGVIALFVFEKHVNRFVRTHSYLYFVSYIIFLGVYIALACCGNLRRKYPTNIILLSVFTVTMSYMLGTISSFHDTKVVFMAVGICAGVCLAVTVFSFHSKFDFTTCGGVLFILIWVLFLFGIIAIFTRDTIMTTVYAGCGALLFVMFLAYDTQMIMGGKKHEMSAEEHIFAAICLYLDVVYIFIFLLMIFGSGQKN